MDLCICLKSFCFYCATITHLLGLNAIKEANYLLEIHQVAHMLGLLHRYLIVLPHFYVGAILGRGALNSVSVCVF